MSAYIKKKSLFGKETTAQELAKMELEDINLKLLHYQNEQLLVNKQVTYLEERKVQLRKQLADGYFGASPAAPAKLPSFSPNAPTPAIA